MNAPTRSDLRSDTGADRMTDEKMDQIRDLLFGDFERQSEARIALLEDRIRELELSLHRRLDALQARLEAMSAQSDASQQQAVDEIARGMLELGERIKRFNAGETSRS